MKEIVTELRNVLRILESVDLLNRSKSIQTCNQARIHRSYNTIENLIKKIEEEYK